MTSVSKNVICNKLKISSSVVTIKSEEQASMFM